MMRFKILYVFVMLSVFSCSNEYEGNIFIYNSAEYKNKVKEFKISIEKASNIAAKINFENYPNTSEYKFTLDFILDDHYVFVSPSRLYNKKTTEYFLSGIWVNGKTGAAIDKKTNKYVKILLDIPSTELTSYSGRINNKCK